MKSELTARLHNAPVVPLIGADDPDVAVRTAEALRDGGLTVIEVVLRSDAAQQCMEAIISRFGKIDLLVTSAGHSHPGYFEDQDNDTFRDSFNINFFGSLYPARSVLPHMKHRKGGKILFIDSGAALIGIFGSSSYCSSKFAVRGLAEVLRSECKPHGIQVSIAYPPDTDTPMLHRNQSLKPWESKLIMKKGGMFSADQVAKSIYRKLRQGKFALATGIKLFLLNG